MSLLHKPMKLAALCGAFALAACAPEGYEPPDHAALAAARDAKRLHAALGDRAVTPQPVEGQSCMGVMELHVGQSTMSFNLEDHMRDAMNSSTQIVTVFASDYAKASEGQTLQSDLRAGSLIMNGTLSTRDVRVRRKLGYVCE